MDKPVFTVGERVEKRLAIGMPGFGQEAGVQHQDPLPDRPTPA